MKSIVVVDNQWGIGKNNDLLFRLKEDMKHFKEETTGKVVVMGSNTLLSLPNSQPLKNRTNIVLWPGGKRDDVILLENLEELLKELKKYNSDDIYVIGGAMMYHTMLPYCDTALVTKVSANGGATVYYDNLDILPNWHIESSAPPIRDGEYKIQFLSYKNSSPKDF